MADLSKRSRGSGQHSEGVKAGWKRRAGSPGDLRSEAQKEGLEVEPREPVASPETLASSPEALKAFIIGDRDYFVRTLQLEPWEDSPLVLRRDRCTQGHAIDARESETGGCHDQHQAHVLRGRIIAELEARGGFRWAELDDRDVVVARVAWGRLASVAEAVGVPEETWAAVLRAAGWEGWWTPDEEEASDG